MEPKELAQAASHLATDVEYQTAPTRDELRHQSLLRAIHPIGQGQAEAFQQGVKQHIELLQSMLGEDEELRIYHFTPYESIRVLQIMLSAWNVVVLVGADPEGNPTQVVSHIHAVNFVCKVVKIKPDQKPTRIGFVMPEAQPPDGSPTAP
ncbi:MAG: hypothetical protein R2729_07195 [Bryobacteraceae bacterium]